jgi:hypothetical protein
MRNIGDRLGDRGNNILSKLGKKEDIIKGLMKNHSQEYGRTREITSDNTKTNERRNAMKVSILNGKSILAVDEKPDFLAGLEKRILGIRPNCTFDTASTFKEASERLASYTYHLIILGNIGGRGFDLLERAIIKKIPVTVLTTHPFSPEALKSPFEMQAMSYLPKEKLKEIVPFIEDVLTDEHSPRWKRLLKRLKVSLESGRLTIRTRGAAIGFESGKG